MKRNLLFSFIILTLLTTACRNPFLQKEEKAVAGPEVPRILEHPQRAAYSVDARAEALRVIAYAVDDGELSYHWYRLLGDDLQGDNLPGDEEGIMISGAVGPSHRPYTGSVSTAYYYAKVTNTLNGKTAEAFSNKAKVEVSAVVYKVRLVTSGEEGSDFASFEEGGSVFETAGLAGEGITLYYAVDNAAYYNRLYFEGVALAVAEAPVEGGAREYAIDPDDAVDGEIIITAVFEHIDLVIDPIAFNTPDQITVTYGDAPFINAVTTAHSGTGEVTYSSGDETIAAVDSDTGEVTILRAGTVIITAWKAADAVYAASEASYTLTVNCKPVTITGLSVQNKTYDGATTATVTGTAVISGRVGADAVSAAGDAAFADANAGTGKTVTFSGWALTGADAVNYSLSAQPASVTANIIAKPVTITGLSVQNKTYDGATAATVTGTAVISGRVGADAVSAAGDAAFADANAGTGKTVTFSSWTLTGADAGNYSLSAQPASVTANIAAKTITITGVTATNRPYNGTTTVTLSGGTLVGVLSADDGNVGFTLGVGTMANANIGNGKTATTDIRLTGSAAGNYSLTQPNITVNITKADISPPVEMVWINAGTFTMGSPDGSGGINGTTAEPNRYADETLHSVTLTTGFYMGKYQVTQAQWVAVMGAGEDRTTTTYGKGNNYPVYYVNWYDAIVFCNKLSMMEGLSPAYRIPFYASTDPADWGTIPTSSNANWNAAEIVTGSNGYRLPTEAQWEYACRAGTTTAFNWNTNQITTAQANFDGRSNLYNGSPAGVYLGRTAEVGSYAPNNWGLYDMHGNVFEWCWDWYNAGYYTDSSAGVDPTGAASGGYRVLRGGFWDYYGQYLRSAYRNGYDPSDRYSSVGFRLLRP